MAGGVSEYGGCGRGLGLRDEVDLIMKRLRIPWREREGGRSAQREGAKEREPKRDRCRERGKREVTSEGEEVGDI